MLAPPLAPSPVASPALSLHALTRLDARSLRELYLGGACAPLAALDGRPRGRMLAVVGLDGDLAGPLIRRLAAAARFPWDGKSFQAADADAGEGINRVRLVGDRDWYPFTTRVEPSVLDGRPCVLLDYDQPENPWFIRRIRDELRAVSPGLFLGPALLRLRGDHRLVLWFAIDHSGR